MTAFADLPTPCALVELAALQRNCRRMGEKAHRLGVRLRPHAKTHKCVEAARLQVEGHFGGLTVSTLAEARHFARGGLRDLTWALPLDPRRLPEVAQLSRQARLQVLLDSEEVMREAEACAAAQGLRLPVFLKVDCGYGRAGVDPHRAESTALAAALARSPHLDFRGVLTHGGHAYHGRDGDEVRAAAGEEVAAATAFAEHLRREGIPVAEVSIGSTPALTALGEGEAAADVLRGVTEVRPGNYAFFDAYQLAIGSCRREDVAFFVLASVIGRYPERSPESSRLLLNVGSLALSLDPGPRHVDPDCGFGRLLSEDGRRELPGLHLMRLSQEHGQVRVDEPRLLEEFPPGARVRVLPNHSCLTAALFDTYHVVEDGEVVDSWQPARGW